MYKIFISFTAVSVVRYFLFAILAVISMYDKEKPLEKKRYQESIDQVLGNVCWLIWLTFMFSLCNIQISLDISNISPKVIIKKIRLLKVGMWFYFVLNMLITIIYICCKILAYYQDKPAKRKNYRVTIISYTYFECVTRCFNISLVVYFTKMILKYSSIIF